MSIPTNPSSTFTAVALNLAPGLVGTITFGVRRVRPIPAALILPEDTAGIQEDPQLDGTSNYLATRTMPPDALPSGDLVEYVTAWPEALVEEQEEIVVGGALVPTAPAWAPTVDEVGKVTPAYTRGGFDDDGQFAGGEQGTYTADTSPTREHVEGLILAACEEVQGRVAVAIPIAQWGLARATAKWHVAAMIAAGKMPAGTDDASGEYRALIANFRNSLDELVRLARMGPSRLA